MDNNKIVDNLNFIKIYFREFIYKIIVVEETWIIQKRDKKILEYRLKTHVSARPSSRKPKKGVQNAPKHESTFGVQKYHSALLECRLALSKCQMTPFWALAQLTLGADKAHPFWPFRRKTHPDSHSTRCYLFFKHSSLYK